MERRDRGGKGNLERGEVKQLILALVYSNRNGFTREYITDYAISYYRSKDITPPLKRQGYYDHITELADKENLLTKVEVSGQTHYVALADSFETFQRLCIYIIKIGQIEQFMTYEYFNVNFGKHLREFILLAFNKELPSTTENDSGMNTLIKILTLSETALTLLIKEPKKFSGLKEFFIWEQDNYEVDKHPEESMSKELYAIHQAIEGLIPIVGICIKIDLINEYVKNGSSSEEYQKLKAKNDTYSSITQYDLRMLNEFFY